MGRSKVVRVHSDLSDILDGWHERMQKEMGLDTFDKTDSSGLLAKNLRELGFPDGVQMEKMKEPKKRRQDFEFKFRL